MRLRRWLFRLYIVVSVLWVGWFGHEIYSAQRSASKAADYIQMYDYERQTGHAPAFDRSELVIWQIQQAKRREAALQAILAFPLLVPIIYFICSWVVRGFKADVGQSESAHLPKKNRILRPGSTLLLIVTILFFPIVWLVDPGAMTNFWVARSRKSDRD